MSYRLISNVLGKMLAFAFLAGGLLLLLPFALVAMIGAAVERISLPPRRRQ